MKVFYDVGMTTMHEDAKKLAALHCLERDVDVVEYEHKGARYSIGREEAASVVIDELHYQRTRVGKRLESALRHEAKLEEYVARLEAALSAQ